MIITQEKSKRVVQSHEFESVNCTIDAEDMRYVASLLRNNYSNSSLAVVREISANALDANIEAGSPRKVEVTVPSQLNPHFVVRDFGGGLSQEDIFGLYSKYGKSTKRNSNNYIGAFGIGKFAPLSYGNNFTVVSYHGGQKTSYNVFVNEEDDTKIVKLHEEPSSELTGLSVEVAIGDEDVDTFRDVVKNFFRFFSDEDMPKFIGVGEDEKFFDDYEVVMEGNDKSWFILEDTQDYWAKTHHQSHAMMGRVHYPLNPDSINFDVVKVDGDRDSEMLVQHLRELASQDNLYIRFDIGQLKLHHSRESLEYNKQTQKEIIEVLKKVRADIEEIAKEKLGDAEDLWDAKVKYAQVVNALPHSLKNIFSESFKWDGIKISSPDIQRNYKWQDQVVIREYRKKDDADATDGYKVSSSQTNRFYPQKDAQLVIQDLKTTYGNTLKARTLFKENADLEVVYSVYWEDDKAEEYVYDTEDGMGFSKINKERILYFSNIHKAQLQSRGKGMSGESRGDVPMFVLDTDGSNRWKRRNMDYWLNCSENIDDLEETDEELVYIAIANYKVVDEVGTGQEESIGLDALLRDVQGVRNIQKRNFKGEDFVFPAVHGIRRKDCKKLTKGRWISFNAYKKRFAKEYLVTQKDKVTSSEKAMCFRENRYTMESFRSVEDLLLNPKFDKVARDIIKDDGHSLIDILDDIAVMKDESEELDTIVRLVNFLRNVDEEWVKENIPSTYNPKEFEDKCKEFITKYPLLTNLSQELYCWQEMEGCSANNLGKNILSYVQLADA